MQRSISLDRGIDIFNHLQTIGSERSGSIGSVWTVDSEGKDSLTDRYRSFEDIPASPYKARSRRASFGMETFSERDLAMAVLNESYKGLDVSSGSVSPQVKKLHRCFTFSGTFNDTSRSSIENLGVKKDKPKLKLVIPSNTDSISCPVSPEIRRLKNFRFRNSAENVGTKMSDDEDQGLEIQEPFYRSISVEWKQGQGEGKGRQRRSGLQGIKKLDLRKEVLVKQEFKSSENLARRRRGSLELARIPSKSPIKGSFIEKNSNLLRLKRNVSFLGNADAVKPTIIISHADIDNSVAKISNTSNYVELGRNCDCRICTEAERGCFVRNVLSKLFIKIVSCREYSRKCYWDENNNLNENEMYNCIMHILKLLLGLWLRHLDHN